MKANEAGKADIWKKFSLVFTKTEDEQQLQPVKHFCACNKCFKVYQYKDADGEKAFGTKNLINHAKQCVGSVRSSQVQMKLAQCLSTKPRITQQDLSLLKLKQVEYCVTGYHSFRSIEHEGLSNLLQTCIYLGAKYGKFEVSNVLSSRKVISRETDKMAATLKKELMQAMKEPEDDGTVSLSIDMYTDDYRKKSYIDIHATWINRDFTLQHAAIAVRHFGTMAHNAENISSVVKNIFKEYALSETDTPATTDHGANIVAALRNNIRLDCMCHRLHTVIECAWRDTKSAEADAASYESAASELCRVVKQSCGLQEQLPKSLKHGGDTRPWIAMYRRAESIEVSYEALVQLLTAKDKLELIGNVSRSLNREIMELTSTVRAIFESMEKANDVTLQLVVPSYYLLSSKFISSPRDSRTIRTFRKYLKQYLDDKFWSSIRAFHWIATFLDPTFKQLEFLPQRTADDILFKRKLVLDLDTWLLAEMKRAEEKLLSQTPAETDIQG